MKIEIDSGSGFCFGVIEAIKKAEDVLERQEILYCLGDIVHNNFEVERLSKLGLVTLSREQYFSMNNCTVLLRAHGEPPETYEYARENNIQLIDATCPVVLRLQRKVKKGFTEVAEEDGQVVIFGKKGHAEVNGLVGQTEGKAIVVQSASEVQDSVDLNKPIILYSQTTKPLTGFHSVIDMLKSKGARKLITHDTICRQVANRIPNLKIFSKKFDLILFVGGEKSSNAKMLYEICKSENERTFFISHPSEIKKEWFEKEDSVGICGATSTPMHLMELAKETLENFKF